MELIHLVSKLEYRVYVPTKTLTWHANLTLTHSLPSVFRQEKDVVVVFVMLTKN